MRRVLGVDGWRTRRIAALFLFCRQRLRASLPSRDLRRDTRCASLQEAFLECGGAQCGICTPGMILAALHLLNKKPKPTMEEIREGLSGNLCRCTGYSQIFEAVAEAARRRWQRHEVRSGRLRFGRARQSRRR